MTRKRSKFWPYKLMVSLMYANHKCVTRTADGTVVVAVAPWAKSLKIKPAYIRGHLEDLVGVGLVTKLHWHHTYFVATLAAPRGYRLEPVNVLEVEVSDAACRL